MTCRPPTISPAANSLMLNLPPVASDTRLQTCSAPPYSVSRLFGQLAAMRQLMFGMPVTAAGACPKTGAAALPTARPAAAFFRNDLRFIESLLRLVRLADLRLKSERRF